MKNLKKIVSAVVIVIMSIVTVKAQNFHALIKPEYIEVLTPAQMKICVSDLYSSKPNQTASIWRYGAKRTKEIYDKILNSSFKGAADQEDLTDEAKREIILNSSDEVIPADYATNPQYAGKIQRYDEAGNSSLWERLLKHGERWLKYHNIPYCLVSCGNGYELNSKPCAWIPVVPTGNPSNNITQSGSDNLIVAGNQNVVSVNPKPKSIMFNPEPDERLVNAANRNTECHTGRTILYCAAAAAIIATAFCLLKSQGNKSGTKDNTYNNNFPPYQGGSGPTTTTGGAGGSYTY